MRKNVTIFVFLMISGTSLFFSCAGSPDIAILPPLVPANVPERPENPPDESDSSVAEERNTPEQAALLRQKLSAQAEEPAPQEPLEKSTWTEGSKQSEWMEQMDRPEEPARPPQAELSERTDLFEWTTRPPQTALSGRTSRPERMERSSLTEIPARSVPQVPHTSVNRPLLGRGQTEAEKLAAFLLMVNSKADPEFVKQLSRLYVEEAALEGIDHDVAFAQMCLETGFLRFGGLVTFDMNNFCGLGSTGPGFPGERFATPQMGVRAQIQHLKGYATAEPPSQDLVDPRYQYVRYGSAPTIEGLAGTWAADRGYAQKIVNVLQRLYTASSITTIADSNTVDSDTD